MKYYVLMMDIIDSRKFKYDIDKAQIFVKKILNILNKKYKAQIRAEARINAGDEIQVLFKDIRGAFQYYRMFEILIYPIKIRAAIGAGDLYHEEAWNTNEMYGEAYFNARKALELCKNEQIKLLYYEKNRDTHVLNAMLTTRDLLSKRGNSIMTNSVQIIAELICPLVSTKNEFIQKYEFEEISNIFDLKKEVLSILNQKLEKNNKYYSKGTSLESANKYFVINETVYQRFIDVIEPCNVEEARINDEVFLTDCWKHGYNVKIASILSVKRQIVDRAMNYIYFPEKRNYDGAILIAMQNL